MPFPSGSISFRQFAVIGQSPSIPEQLQLDALANHAFQDDNGFCEEVEYGWSGASHLYDGTFTFEKDVFADCLYFALRIETTKVPGDVVKAYTLMEESAVAANNPGGFLSKLQKREARDTVNRKVEAEQKSGKHRRARAIPILWDMQRGVVYAQVAGLNFDKLAEIFERTFKLELHPVTAGRIARDYAAASILEDLRPTKFADGPDEIYPPEYPWVAKMVDSRAFLGDEFLLWMLWQAHVEVSDFIFDRRLELECAFGATGKHSIKGNAPDRLREVHEAMAGGKIPRKAGVTALIDGGGYDFVFDPELFAFGGAKLPAVEDAETPRVLFEERIAMVRGLCVGMEKVFAKFLAMRTSAKGWEFIVKEIREWIGEPAAVAQ